MQETKINMELKYASDFELWLRFFRDEKLYVTTALIGGFRLRSKNQISLNNYDAYIKELEKCIASEKFDSKVTTQIKKIIFYNKLNLKLARFNIGRLKIKHFDLFEYPPKVIFNRGLQKFELIKTSGYF